MFSVVIIGGMAAGCKAAARLSRLCSEYDITIVERSNYISFGNCGLPLYAAGEVDDFYALSKTAYGVIRDEEYFKMVKGVKVLTKKNERVVLHTLELLYVLYNHLSSMHIQSYDYSI